MANNINCDAKQMESVFFEKLSKKVERAKEQRHMYDAKILVHLPHCVYATWFILNFS